MKFQEAAVAAQNNFDDAKQTYGGFVGLMKWGTILSFVIAAIVVLIIST